MTLDLSQRRHYTFPQLAALLPCSEEDLRYFVVAGELTPSRFLETGRYRQYQMEPHEDYGTTGHVSPSAMCDACEPDDVPQRGWSSGFHYLVLPLRTSGNQCEFRFAATFPSGFDLGDIIYELETSMGIDDVMNNGVVMAVELARFVALKSRNTKPIGFEKSLDTRQRTTYLNIIGVLLEQLTAGTANDTTVITQAVSTHGTKFGISKRKLEEVFAAAKRGLCEN